jgi:hypothetical protein
MEPGENILSLLVPGSAIANLVGIEGMGLFLVLARSPRRNSPRNDPNNGERLWYFLRRQASDATPDDIAHLIAIFGRDAHQ